MTRARNFGRFVAALILLASAASCSRSAKSYFDSGNQYFDQKKYKEAIVEYQNAIRKDLKFGEAHYKLAEALSETRNLQGAYQEYQRAADLLPASKEAQLKAGVFLLIAKQFEDAKTRAQAALKIDPRYVDALILLANAKANLNDIGDAIKNIQEAIQIDPLQSGSYINLGGFQQARGDTKDAEATYQKALELGPKSVPAHMALANFYLSTGRNADAERLLKAAAELDPKNAQVSMTLAMYYIRSNQVGEAEPYLKTAAADNWRASLVLANFYVATKRVPEAMVLLETVAKEAKDKEAFAEARSRVAAIQYSQNSPSKQAEAHQTLDEVLKRDPNSVTALLLDARFLVAEKKYDEALERAKRATAAEPGNATAHYTLGTVYAARNDPDEAIKEYNETLRISPRAAAAQVELARLYLLRGAVDRGAVDSAAQFAEQAVQNQPDNVQARLTLIRTLMARRDPAKGDLVRADAELKPLVARYPESAPIQAEWGTLLVGRGDLAGARKAYEKALQLAPASYEALAGLVALDVAEKKPSAARARLDARLTQAPDDEALLLLSARTYYAAKDLEKTEQTLLKLIQVAPGSLEAYELLGRLYVVQNRLDQAVQKFEEQGKRQSKPVAAYTMIAMILQMQRKGAEAQKRYERVLELDPRAAVAANNLAWIYAEGGGNLDTALQLARTAKEQLPNAPQVNDTLGWIYVKKDLPSLAVPLLEAAVAAAVKDGQDNATYHYHLGMAYIKTDKAKAKASLERALKLDPNFDGSAEARKALAEIG
jgi:putative PEP-CTERM system TPR-repeat lipoprotein